MNFLNSSKDESKDCSSSHSDKSSFYRVNDFERYTDSYPNEFDCVINDTLDSKSKAIDHFQEAFQIPTPLSLAVDSRILKSSQSAFPKPLEFVSGIMKPVKPSVFEFTISKDLFIKTSIHQLIAPPKPFIVLPCNFTTSRDLDEVISVIKHTLEKDFVEIDYEFIEFECFFKGVYIRGSRYSDFNIRIYENTGKSGLLVEFQRLHRDSCGFTFNYIFECVKRTISGTFSPTSTVDLNEGLVIDDFSPMELSASSTLSDDEISESIKQVLSMAKEASFQSQQEACRILCDLSDEAEIRQRMAANDCVKTLVDMVKNDRVLIRQHAILALAQLSECQECIIAIMNSTLLPILITLIGNGPYFTAAMRRECARILANTSAKKPADVVSLIGKDVLSTWVNNTLSEITDHTIRERAQRALSYLQPYMV